MQTIIDADYNRLTSISVYGKLSYVIDNLVIKKLFVD